METLKKNDIRELNQEEQFKYEQLKEEFECLCEELNKIKKPTGVMSYTEYEKAYIAYMDKSTELKNKIRDIQKEMLNIKYTPADEYFKQQQEIENNISKPKKKKKQDKRHTKFTKNDMMVIRSLAGHKGGEKGQKIVIKDIKTEEEHSFNTTRECINFIGCSPTTFYKFKKGENTDLVKRYMLLS